MATKSKKPTSSTYTKEFKENAVRLALFGDKSQAEVARELGMPSWKLRDWIRSVKKAMPQDAVGKSPLDELAALKKENKALRMDVEILKKAAAFFAKSLS